MSKSVHVSGIGIISSLGSTKEEHQSAFIAEKSGVGQISILPTAYKDSLLAGEIKKSTDDLKELCGLSLDSIHSRTSLLALFAAQKAAKNAGFDSFETLSDPMALLCATSVGGMDLSELHFEAYKNGDEAKIDFFRTHDCGDCTETIAKYLKISGMIGTISTACSSSANAIMMGARLIKNGLVNRALVGGSDALSIFTLNGFNALKILDHELCRPFDETRAGLNLGEGAAFLMLESEESLGSKKSLGKVVGYANTEDAFHQTASSPEGKGAGLAMETALKIAGLKPADIDYINAHGTATRINDESEGMAIKRIFGSTLPPFSSTKAFTGHTLGAAGALEAVFSLLSIESNQAPINLNFKQQMEDLKVSPLTEKLQNAPINHVLSNSFGFGGNCSSLIFSA